MLQRISDMFTHMEWADSRMWHRVLQSDQLARADPILELLAHLHMTQHAFLDTWKGRAVRERNPRDTYADASAMCGWARSFYPEVSEFIATLDEGRLPDEHRLPWAHYFAKVIGHDPEATTLGDTLLQIVLHTTHHRAQVAREIRTLGVDPLIVDYVAWAWMGRPAPSWP